ncbi:MAG TPA: FAD-dependent oxidoreductase, partial [Burkholderiaceae bacterium]
MSSAPPSTLDCAILGGGPAGCSAAAWGAQLGLKVGLFERAETLCPNLAALDFAQESLLGHPGETLAAQGKRYAAHLAALRVPISLNARLEHLDWQVDAGWTLHLAGQPPIHARALLLATGLRPRRPEQLFPASKHVLDALSLTAQRARLKPGRVLLLGGGDNAVENALFLAERGHQVTIWSRSDWRAQAAFTRRLVESSIERRSATPLPTRVTADAEGVTVQSTMHGEERFDHLAVLLGYEPEP